MRLNFVCAGLLPPLPTAPLVKICPQRGVQRANWAACSGNAAGKPWRKSPDFSGRILEAADPFLFCAVHRTQQDSGLSFESMSDDPAAAMVTSRRNNVNGTFKAVEMCFPRQVRPQMPLSYWFPQTSHVPMITSW